MQTSPVQSWFRISFEEGINQLELGDARLGIVAISVSRLLHFGDPDETPVVSSTSSFMETALEHFAREAQRIAAMKDFTKTTGILLYAFTPLFVEPESLFIPVRKELFVPIAKSVLDNDYLELLSRECPEFR
jgi:hypothetical protein